MLKKTRNFCASFWRRLFFCREPEKSKSFLAFQRCRLFQQLGANLSEGIRLENLFRISLVVAFCYNHQHYLNHNQISLSKRLQIIFVIGVDKREIFCYTVNSISLVCLCEWLACILHNLNQMIEDAMCPVARYVWRTYEGGEKQESSNEAPRQIIGNI